MPGDQYQHQHPTPESERGRERTGGSRAGAVLVAGPGALSGAGVGEEIVDR